MTDDRNDGTAGDRDPRPKPKYGELAPPGWTWQPPPDPYATPAEPADEDQTPAASGSGWAPPRPGTAGPGAQPQPGAPGAPGAAGAQPGGPVRPRRTADRVASIALLAFGLLSLFNNVPTLLDLDGFMRQFADVYGLDGWKPTQDLSAAGVGVAVFWVVLYLVTVWLTVTALRRNRIAFWIPLTAGVIATLSSTVLYMVALLSDPTVLDQLSTAPPL